MKRLQTSYTFNIRFSEIDAMKVVWHGAYAKYLEDAREAFGREFKISYQQIEAYGYYAPIVELSISYKESLRYGMTPTMIITYLPTDAAKMEFEYEIRDSVTGKALTTAHSVQVFTNLKYELQLFNPPFYEDWKKSHLGV